MLADSNRILQQMASKNRAPLSFCSCINRMYYFLRSICYHILLYFCSILPIEFAVDIFLFGYWVCTCTYICLHTHTHTHTHTRARAHARARTHAHKHMCIYARAHAHTRAHTHLHFATYVEYTSNIIRVPLII